MFVRKIAVAVLLLIIGLNSNLSANERTIMLIDKLAEKGVISYGEAHLLKSENIGEPAKKLTESEYSDFPKWIQNLSVKGDLRLRHQADWAANSNVQKTRECLRLRLDFETKTSENIKAGFGFSSGVQKVSGTDVIDKQPQSTNYTFSNGFAKAPLMINYAYLEYTPLLCLKITAGKMKSGANVWQASDLKWSSDINPDGVAVTANKDVIANLNFFLTASWLIFSELNSAVLNNPDAYIIQPGVTWKINDKYKIKAAAAFENFYVSGKNTSYYGTPVFDYKCVNPSIEVSANKLIGSYSLTFFSDMINNTDSNVDKDKNGSAYGICFGFEKVKNFGDWQIKYISRRIEQNAWLNKLGDPSAYCGEVNSSGYEAVISFGLAKATVLNLDYYNMDVINGSNSGTPKSLLQAEIVYKF